MIGLVVVGASEVIARMEALPANLRRILLARMHGVTLRVKARVQKKLSGEVLKVRSGALHRSILSEVKEETNEIIGRVFSSGDVKYARIHEFGGTTRAHIIEPRRAPVLAFVMGGNTVFARRVHHPGSRMPERSFMRSTLTELRGVIVHDLSDGILAAAARGPGA